MTVDEAIKDLEYSSKQLKMEIKSGLWIKGSESELHCKEGITLNKQYIEWLKELKNLREENKVLIQKCDKLIKGKGVDVQPVKHGRWIDNSMVYTCSECNSSVPKNIFITGCDFEGCPYCFARMDGDKDTNVRNLTDEETAVYESRIEREAKDTGVNIMEGDSK